MELFLKYFPSFIFTNISFYYFFLFLFFVVTWVCLSDIILFILFFEMVYILQIFVIVWYDFLFVFCTTKLF